MASGDNKKTFFNLIIILILIGLGYFFLKNKLGVNLGNLNFTFIGNPLIKLIGVILILFVFFTIIKSFIKLVSNNV